jgi:alkylhydroperoxidase family enzyme
MSDDKAIASEIKTYFHRDSMPAVFERMTSAEEYLAVTWRRYQAVMTQGEIDRATKELMGFSVGVAKANEYVIAWQREQLRAAGIGPAEETEAIAVADFFEGFDAFALALRVDSDLRPRKLAAGDMSLIDQEIDVNVPYVMTPEDATVREVYDDIKTRMGIPFIPNIFKALAHQPDTLKAKWECYKATMGSGRLRRLTKELIAVAVSAVNACFY